MFLENENEIEIKSLKAKLNSEVEVLEKIDPLYSTLRRLRYQAI